jgi:hypothetical protein
MSADERDWLGFPVGFNGPISMVPAGASAARVSDEQFAKMSAAERINYARQFPQENFQRDPGRLQPRPKGR